MFKIVSWYKQAKRKMAVPLRSASKSTNGFGDKTDVHLKIFLYELEKKLIRLEVSLRRLRDDPTTSEQFLRLLRQIITEMETLYTSEVDSALRRSDNPPFEAEDYHRMVTELKKFRLQLENQIQERMLSNQLVGQLQEDVKMLLDRQITRSLMGNEIVAS